MAEFYKHWGLIDMLSEVAKTKIFDIPNSGLDSVECAMLAPAYKVLTYVSMEYEKYRSQKAALKSN